jgi:hypothetical protein
LAALLLAGMLAFAPAPAQAATDSTTKWGHWGANHSTMGGFWITGVVTAVDGENITVRLPDNEDAEGIMRNISIEVTLAVSGDSILLGNDLAAVEAAALQEGAEVVIVPRLVWGNLTARMIFVGAPDDLTDHTYRGRLVSEVENTLTLDVRREGEIQVVVDENTIWYDEGRVERPAQLPEEAPLRVLGVEQEDGSIRAVLITSGARGF